MQNSLSDIFLSAGIIVIVTSVLILLSIGVPALTPRRWDLPEKVPQLIRRVFLRRRK